MSRALPLDWRFRTRIEFAFGQQVGTVADLENQDLWDWTSVSDTHADRRLVLPMTESGLPRAYAATPWRPELDLGQAFALDFIDVAMPWSDGLNRTLARTTLLDNNGWEVRKTSANRIMFIFGTGSTLASRNFTSFAPPANGVTISLRIVFLAGVCQLYRKDNSWDEWEFVQQVGTTQTVTYNESSIRLGERAVGQPLGGSIGSFYARKIGLLGGVVASADFQQGTLLDLAGGTAWRLDTDPPAPEPAVLKQIAPGVQGYVLEQPISITQGRRDEVGELTPGSCDIELDNPDGRFSPDNPMSPLWPNVRRGTPMRVRVYWEGDWYVRFAGLVSEWEPDWPYGDLSADGVKPGESRVRVSAAGFTRRLGQGEAVVSSALYRAIMQPDLDGTDPSVHRVSYWPLEDQPDAKVGQNHSTLRGPRASEPFVAFGDYEFGSDSSLPASAPVLHFNGGFAFEALTVLTPAAVGVGWDVEFNMKLDGPPPGAVPIMTINCIGTTDTAGVARWTLTAHPTTFHVQGFRADGVQVVNSNFGLSGELPIIGGNFYDYWQRIMLRVWQLNASTTQWVWATTPSAALGQFQGAGSTFTGPAGRISRISNFASPPDGGLSYAHVVTTRGVNVDALGTKHSFQPSGNTAWEDEPAGARHERLCRENEVLPLTHGNPLNTTHMGPQRAGSILQLLDECGAAEAAFYAEAHDKIALRMVSRRTAADRDSFPPPLVFDAARSEIDAVAPILDDQRYVNDVTASTAELGERRVVDSEARTREGQYATSLDVNVLTVSQLTDAAGWRLALGQAAGESRIPEAGSRLDIAAPVIGHWLNTQVGGRVILKNLPRPQHPVSEREFMLQGWTETIEPHSWRINSLNLTSSAPWEGKVIAFNPGGDQRYEARVAPRFVRTASAVNATTTVIPTQAGDSFAKNFTTDPTEAGFDVVIGGEQMHVIEVTSTGGENRTLLVDRSVNGVVKSHPSQSRVTLAYPTRLIMGIGSIGREKL